MWPDWVFPHPGNFLPNVPDGGTLVTKSDSQACRALAMQCFGSAESHWVLGLILKIKAFPGGNVLPVFGRASAKDCIDCVIRDQQIFKTTNQTERTDYRDA
jgi:hypothetical protein